MQPAFVNGTYLGKSLKKGFLNPGKPWNLVFASSGKSWKKHFNVCMNPVMLLLNYIIETSIAQVFYKQYKGKRNGAV